MHPSQYRTYCMSGCLSLHEHLGHGGQGGHVGHGGHGEHGGHYGHGGEILARISP